MVDYRPVIIGIVVTVLFGLISLFTASFGFFVQIILGTLAIILGGLAAAYTTDGDNTDGGVHGAISGIVGGALLCVLFLIVTINDFTFPAIFTGILVGGIVFGFNFGIIGAVIGNIIKRRSQKTIKDNGYLVCNKCGSYYKLNQGEYPEDYDNECDCGGKVEYKKSNKPDFKLILDYKVFGVGVILCIVGTLMLTLVFQLQIEYLLRISVIILGIGIIVMIASIFNL